MKVAEMNLLDILERERAALRDLQSWKDGLERSKRVYSVIDESEKVDNIKRLEEEMCSRYASLIDKAERELAEARRDMKMYFTYHGIRCTEI